MLNNNPNLSFNACKGTGTFGTLANICNRICKKSERFSVYRYSYRPFIITGTGIRDTDNITVSIAIYGIRKISIPHDAYAYAVCGQKDNGAIYICLLCIAYRSAIERTYKFIR
jgi:hypothetical protein